MYLMMSLFSFAIYWLGLIPKLSDLVVLRGAHSCTQGGCAVKKLAVAEFFECDLYLALLCYHIFMICHLGNVINVPHSIYYAFLVAVVGPSVEN